MMRTFIRAAILLLLVAAFALAQDAEWLRYWESAQRARPARIGPVGRIAPSSEPGAPLVVHGRVFASDGTTPAANVVVFAYHTDRTGVYNARGASGWRLRGWARTDEQGRFEFRTIRPGSYPEGRNPAHIHLAIEGPRVPRQWAQDLQFADDPFVTSAMKIRSAAAGQFGSVRAVKKREGVQHVDLNIRVDAERRF